jgi:hypothetical protein
MAAAALGVRLQVAAVAAALGMEIQIQVAVAPTMAAPALTAAV